MNSGSSDSPDVACQMSAALTGPKPRRTAIVRELQCVDVRDSELTRLLQVADRHHLNKRH